MIGVPEESTKSKYHEYITFIAEDAVRPLKDYLNTRRSLTSESLLRDKGVISGRKPRG
jgi:hypothetical protein